MKIRVISKKFKNLSKFNFLKKALELNPFMLGRCERHRSVSQMFSGRNNLEGPFYVLFNFIAVQAKNHKSEDQNPLRMVPLIFIRLLL